MMSDKHVELENAYLSVKTKQEAEKLIGSCNSDSIMISMHSPDGKYTLASDTSENLIGYTPKELKDQSPYDYFHAEDFQAILKSHAKVTIRPEVDRVNYRIRVKDGSYKRVRSLSRQITDPNGFEFIFVITFSEG